MNRLPYDYTRCVNDECPLRENCLRFTDRPEGVTRLIYSLFQPDNNKKCKHQIKPSKQIQS